MSTSKAVIIGAGPFGLSVSSHLQALGVDHVIAGRPMDTWRTHMPGGMILKSEPYASEIASPHGGYGLKEYSKAHGLEYADRVGPVPLDRFLEYADWYTKQLVPEIREDFVSQVDPIDGGFRVSFEQTAPVVASNVVIAVGLLPFFQMPDELSSLPSAMVTHTSDPHDLEDFKGRRVAVIGAGQSALEMAALLNEQGADVTVIARRPVVSWADPNPAHVSLLGQLQRPVVKLCEGWRCVFWNSPAAFRFLPEEMRVTKARTVLGPSGSWWLKNRVHDVIEVLTSHRVTKAVPEEGHARLFLDGPRQATLDVDHVICGTGFRMDLARVPFMPDTLRSGIKQVSGYPVVNRAGESSVPGLYFAGALAAASLGPSERFIAGTHNSARPLAASVARRSRARQRQNSTGQPRTGEPTGV